MRVLTAIPVYNEERHLASVIREVQRYSADIVVVNDGSTDRTGELLAQFKDIHVISHARNRGYGAALISARETTTSTTAKTRTTISCSHWAKN